MPLNYKVDMYPLYIYIDIYEEDINTNQTREAVNVEIFADVHLGSGT
jgi:hypothetical protein